MENIRTIMRECMETDKLLVSILIAAYMPNEK